MSRRPNQQIVNRYEVLTIGAKLLQPVIIYVGLYIREEHEEQPFFFFQPSYSSLFQFCCFLLGLYSCSSPTPGNPKHGEYSCREFTNPNKYHQYPVFPLWHIFFAMYPFNCHSLSARTLSLGITRQPCRNDPRPAVKTSRRGAPPSIFFCLNTLTGRTQDFRKTDCTVLNPFDSSER
jgi:hypothetical protein